jgi:hypothetical protein
LILARRISHRKSATVRTAAKNNKLSTTYFTSVYHIDIINNLEPILFEYKLTSQSWRGKFQKVCAVQRSKTNFRKPPELLLENAGQTVQQNREVITAAAAVAYARRPKECGVFAKFSRVGIELVKIEFHNPLTPFLICGSQQRPKMALHPRRRPK